MVNILKEIILDFQKEKLNTGIKRHLDYQIIKGKVFTCIGVRRCGKSTLLYQIINDLQAEGAKRDDILYLNFFDDRLTEVKSGNLSPIIEAYYSLYPEKKGSKEIYCFFDEIQETKNWEPFVDRILRTEKCSVFISGSSSKFLSKEIATQMRGRSLAWELFPFSFKEYLDYKGINYMTLTSKNRLLIQKIFNEYFLKGGFPEVRDVTDKVRVMIHQEYYKSILHRDIIERFNALHPQAVIRLGYRLICSAASMYSINRATQHLKSLGHRVSKEFVSSCVNWFEDAFFLFSVKIFNPSVSKQNANTKKVYCVDHSMVISISPAILANKGHLLENMVFVHLRRMTDEIYYYRTQKGHEVDFIWIDGKGMRRFVQVCYSLKDRITRKREISSLMQAMEEQGHKEATIITFEEEEILEENNKKIHVIPAWKWMARDTT